jgi:hypothetical protein
MLKAKHVQGIWRRWIKELTISSRKTNLLVLLPCSYYVAVLKSPYITQIIKKFTVRHLDAVGISKPHPEFKELFGFVYRGTAFALVRDHFPIFVTGSSFSLLLSSYQRATINKSPVSARALDALVEAHIKLYLTPPT